MLAGQEGPATDAETDSAQVRAQLRDRADAIRRRELDRALSKLDARGDLTDEQRRIVDELAASIARRIVATPQTRLRRSSLGDAETARVVSELFDLNDGPEEG